MLESIVIVVVDHIPCSIPAKHDALHVICKHTLRNPHHGEGMYYPYEQVLLPGVWEELYIPESAVMTHHYKVNTSPCIACYVDYVYESSIHLVAVATLSGVSTAPVPLRGNSMTWGWYEIAMTADIVLRD